MLRFHQASGILRSSVRTAPAAYSTAAASAADAAPTLSQLPSYDALRALDLAAKPASYTYDAARGQAEFARVLDNVQHRFRPDDIPARFRHLVLRPKNVTILRSVAEHVVDKQGNTIRDPEVIHARPSGKILMRLIKRIAPAQTGPVEEAEELEEGEAVAEEPSAQAKAATVRGIVARYLKDYPDKVLPEHIAALLTASARAGSLYPTTQFVFDTVVLAHPHLLDIQVAREALRLYAIRAVALAKDTAARDLFNLYTRLSTALASAGHAPLEQDARAQWIVLYGLAPYASSTNSTVAQYVQPFASAAAAAAASDAAYTPPAPASRSSRKVPAGLRLFILDLHLARLAAAAAPAATGLDAARLDTALAAAETARTRVGVTKPYPFGRYVEQAARGILYETQQARARNPPVVEEEAAAAEEAEEEK